MPNNLLRSWLTLCVIWLGCHKKNTYLYWMWYATIEQKKQANLLQNVIMYIVWKYLWKWLPCSNTEQSRGQTDQEKTKRRPRTEKEQRKNIERNEQEQSRTDQEQSKTRARTEKEYLGDWKCTYVRRTPILSEKCSFFIWQWIWKAWEKRKYFPYINILTGRYADLIRNEAHDINLNSTQNYIWKNLCETRMVYKALFGHLFGIFLLKKT